MRPILSYYGGKQKMVPTILPLLPPHDTYCELFAGGAAVFWAKPLAKVNVLNDIDSNIVSVYRVFADPQLAGRLFRKLENSPHSEEIYQEAKQALKDPDIGVVDRAYLTFIQCNHSFAHKIGAGYGYSRGGDCYMNNLNKTTRSQLVMWLQKLKNCHIFQRDALKLIELYDSPRTLFYLDPPYVDTNQGHYGGYTIANFTELVERLKTISGRFLLSHYADDATMALCSGFQQICKETSCTVNKNIPTARVEGLFANYQLELAGLLA